MLAETFWWAFYIAHLPVTTRGCTGFDGLTEDGEAVRGREPRKKLELNLNAEDNLALAA